jgi:hypothetical protein
MGELRHEEGTRALLFSSDQTESVQEKEAKEVGKEVWQRNFSNPKISSNHALSQVYLCFLSYLVVYNDNGVSKLILSDLIFPFEKFFLAPLLLTSHPELVSPPCF